MAGAFLGVWDFTLSLLERARGFRHEGVGDFRGSKSFGRECKEPVAGDGVNKEFILDEEPPERFGV